MLEKYWKKNGGDVERNYNDHLVRQNALLQNPDKEEDPDSDEQIVQKEVKKKEEDIFASLGSFMQKEMSTYAPDEDEEPVEVDSKSQKPKRQNYIKDNMKELSGHDIEHFAVSQ